MAISDIKKGFTREKGPEKIEASSQKSVSSFQMQKPVQSKEKEDVSVFAKNESIERGNAARIVRGDKNLLYSKYGLSGQDTEKLAQRVSDFKTVQFRTEKKELEEIRKDIEKEARTIPGIGERIKKERVARYLKDRFGA